MKRVALLLFCLNLLTACGEDGPTPEASLPATPPVSRDSLPPPTQIGARSGGFLLNGRAWVAESYLLVHPVYGEYVAEDILYLEFNRNIREPRQHARLALHIPGVRGVGTYLLLARVTYPEGDEYFGVTLHDISQGRQYVGAPGSQVGVVEITRFDPQARIASGRFSFALPSPWGEQAAAEGRFDTTFDIAPSETARAARAH